MSARVLLLAALSLPVAAACSMGGDSSTSANRAGASTAGESDAAIDSVMAKYIAAVESGDTAAIAATLSEDAEVVFPTGPLHKGRSEVIGAFAEMFASMDVSELRTVEQNRAIEGDMAVESGAFSITLQPKGAASAGEVVDRGYYMVVWERQDDGSWKMARGINRSDAPAGATAASGAGGR